MTVHAAEMERLLSDCTYTKITVVVELADMPPGYPQSATVECGPGRAQMGIGRTVEARAVGPGDEDAPVLITSVFSQPVFKLEAKPFYDQAAMIVIASGGSDGQGAVRPADPS